MVRSKDRVIPLFEKKTRVDPKDKQNNLRFVCMFVQLLSARTTSWYFWSFPTVSNLLPFL